MNYKARNFSKESYDDNDSLAKKIFIKYITKYGYEIISSKETYKHDIIATKNGVKYYFELEMKTGYPFKSKESFKFDTVSFCGRKEKLHNNMKFKYVIICKETGWGVGCDSDIIFNENYIEKLYINTIHRQGDDLFYRVPKDKCSFFNLMI